MQASEGSDLCFPTLFPSFFFFFPLFFQFRNHGEGGGRKMLSLPPPIIFFFFGGGGQLPPHQRLCTYTHVSALCNAIRMCIHTPHTQTHVHPPPPTTHTHPHAQYTEACSKQLFVCSCTINSLLQIITQPSVAIQGGP